ncbi:MAG: VOC family protein, partial [Terriglobia bacterium]
LMPLIEKHVPGTFCWIELGTTDQATAKHFYHTLFGWTHNDILMGPNHVYSIFQLEGRSVAAAYTLRHEQQSKGVQPHWMLYVAVDSADEAASRAASLGGSILTAPGDVPDAGRMAVLQDPAGAVFSVWQSRNHIGTEMNGVDGTLCWADLMTPDPVRAKEFYSALFGWKLAANEKESSGYLHIANGEKYIGGIPPAEHRDPNVPPHWLSYFAVSDCDKAAAAAIRNEAIACSPPTTLENVGRMAVVTDTEGARFAIFQALPHTPPSTH